MLHTYAFLRDGASDGGTLHFTLRVDNDTSVILYISWAQTDVNQYLLKRTSK